MNFVNKWSIVTTSDFFLGTKWVYDYKNRRNYIFECKAKCCRFPGTNGKIITKILIWQEASRSMRTKENLWSITKPKKLKMIATFLWAPLVDFRIKKATHVNRGKATMLWIALLKKVKRREAKL